MLKELLGFGACLIWAGLIILIAMAFWKPPVAFVLFWTYIAVIIMLCF